ncbi:ABC transporter ATP-binding protein [Peptostreptococcus faecalis]|uniref:ABC transporter ATP-binding protein n=1 Tax=Peptostreptococcus faecalis TaxID=2045015 RepID=UPI000C7E4DFD|nr:ABC transporter ATP-binding protein [Peptostreptococcus faecalis]
MNSCQKKNKITVSNMDKYYEGSKILSDINIHIDEGELVTIVGPSGSGKSTIFNIITGLTKEDSGSIFVNGEISYMYQKDLLLPYKTILDNVSLPLILKGQKKREARDIVKPYFKIFGLENYEKNYPSDLSGGMRQRVNFLRTFICSSDIILLDEPFGALDSITKSSIQEWFIDIKKSLNSTICMITHDIDEAIKLSDRIYVISSRPANIKKEFNLSSFDKNNVEEVSNLKKKIINYFI